MHLYHFMHDTFMYYAVILFQKHSFYIRSTLKLCRPIFWMPAYNNMILNDMMVDLF